MASVGWRVVVSGWDPLSEGGQKRRKETRRRTTDCISVLVRESIAIAYTQIRAGPSSSLLLDSGTVLPVKVHTNPETGQILNLVFVWADGDYELNVDVPLVFKGEDVCPGLKKGGYLNTIRTSLQYLCPVEHIPPKIEVDLSNLDIGDKVLMSDVVVLPSLKLLSKNENMPVCKIMTTRSEIKDPTETL
ncbi:50S ribosomal protein L25-like protein [Cinnamomum micranthum f. kanehirae]|uniref:50S ribosomal protein L25-like protein n=1 Tax=Cinnamomum micranthum f. kanehirae TaxID=337451 RepID=A0A3S3M588_9MAGN|nr:50S ribosomal protein L25-like protein [Cinnamomum micranthum f. kanehirae]